jgi:hypothetical protein
MKPLNDQHLTNFLDLRLYPCDEERVVGAIPPLDQQRILPLADCHEARQQDRPNRALLSRSNHRRVCPKRLPVGPDVIRETWTVQPNPRPRHAREGNRTNTLTPPPTLPKHPPQRLRERVGRFEAPGIARASFDQQGNHLPRLNQRRLSPKKQGA